VSKKKKQKKKTHVQKPAVQLSQCMIVKNEEKNIENALSWAKDITYEQIVVDTGSTDRTVELAEKMGAKVFHFEWINDFSAAKNYAIEQATGNWIAFLDADEYCTPEDAEKLITLLNKIEKNPELRNETAIVSTPLINLDDQNKAFSVYRQRRFFRNLNEIRYQGRIHEALTSLDRVTNIDDISIMHTGYAVSAYKGTSKTERNVELLRAELADRPDDIFIKAYLADSLNNKAKLENPEGSGADPEADILFEEVINSSIITRVMKKKAYMYFMQKIIGDPDEYPEYEELCTKAIDDFNDDLDFEYMYACILNKKGKYEKAWEILRKLESALSESTDHGETIYIKADPGLLYEQMLGSAQGLSDIGNVINYATVVLMLDKTKDRILNPYISTLMKNGASEEEIIDLLAKVYDFNDPGDLMQIARAAKSCGAIEFAGNLMKIAGELLGY